MTYVAKTDTYLDKIFKTKNGYLEHTEYTFFSIFYRHRRKKPIYFTLVFNWKSCINVM